MEKPKIVMRISNGKVSYSSVDNPGEKIVTDQAPKKLVAYDDDDDDDDSSSSDKDAKPVINGINTLQQKINGSGSTEDVPKPKLPTIPKLTSPKPKPELKPELPKPDKDASFEPVLDNRLTTTTQVPGSYGPLDKSPIKQSSEVCSRDVHQKLKKSHSMDTTLSVRITSPPELVRATTPNWHINDQDAQSPSVASSNGSVNSTTGSWHIHEQNEKRRLNLLAEAQHQGWVVTPPSKHKTLSSTTDALVNDISPRAKTPNRALFGKSKDDSFVESSTYLNSSNRVISPEKLNGKWNLDTDKIKKANGTLENGVGDYNHDKVLVVDTNGFVNGDGDSEDVTKKKKKKKKKRQKEEGEVDSEDSLEPPTKKHKKKKKKHKRDLDELLSPRSDVTNSSSSSSKKGSSDSQDTSNGQKRDRNGANDSGDAKRRKTSEADEDSELEEGEWVEVTKETIEQEREQEKKQSQTHQGKYNE